MRRQFDVVADAPNGVQKLRELILQLAVRGKLVAQDPSDEPASVLLERIVAEKKRLEGQGETRKQRALSAIGGEDVPFDVPEGWAWVRLGQVIELISGQHLTPAEYNDRSDGIPYLTGPADFGAVSPTASRWTTVRRAIAVRGDVLLTVKGAGIGKTNVLLVTESAISRQLMAIRSVLMYPLYTSLIARSAVERFRIEQVGIAIPGIGREDVLHLVIPLPPLAEQHRIVAKVDEMMALCDELETRQQRRNEVRARLNRSALHHLTSASDDEELAAHWERLRENFHLIYDTPESVAELRQAVLQLAVRGKLVPQDPSDEPASVLLERIATEKERLVAGGKIREQKALPPISEGEVPFEVPEGWAWARFGNATINRDAERVPVSSGIRAGRQGAYPYYGASGVIDCIDDYLFDTTLLLVGEDGANLLLRSTPIAFFAEGKYWVNNHAHVIDGISVELLRFIALVVNATDLAPYVTGTAQPKLNQAKLNGIPLALPPEREQQRIVAKVDALMALCGELEARITQARESSACLAASVVHHITTA